MAKIEKQKNQMTVMDSLEKDLVKEFGDQIEVIRNNDRYVRFDDPHVISPEPGHASGERGSKFVAKPRGQ